MSDPTLEQQMLNLGSIISKGEFGINSSFSIEEETTEPFQVRADLISTGRTCVIGSSGSGKSYTVGVICEELCRARVPFAIIDVEGEYSGLKEKYEAIWVGDDNGCDLYWSEKVDLKRLAKYAPDCPPIVFDLTEASRPKEKVNEFLVSLYYEVSRRRTPYLVIVEEADRFSPQTGGERLQVVDEIARRGRKRGLGLMLCTQRPSLVDKNILSQCSNQMIGKLVIKNDLNSVAQFFSGRDSTNVLTSLKPGEFFALGGLAREPTKVKIRERETRHGGMTPTLKPAAVRPTVDKILESIQNGVPIVALDRAQEVTIALPPQRTRRESPPTPPAIPIVSEIDVTEKIQDTSTPKPTGDQQVAELPMDDFLDWDTGRKENGVQGLSPLIEAESVPGLLKLEKSYKLFGQKENVTRVGLAFRPLVEIGVRIRSGVLKKKFETKYFFIDGVSAKLVELTDRLGYRSGVERLLGLDEGQIIILKTLFPEKDLSVIEIAGETRRTEDETRNLLRGLASKRLVRITKLGRAKVYRRLIDVPKIDLLSEPMMRLNELDATEDFKLAKLKVREDMVREVIKGMWKGADLESFRQIYYPVYLAEVLLNRRKRYVWIDGRTGKEIQF